MLSFYYGARYFVKSDLGSHESCNLKYYELTISLIPSTDLEKSKRR